MDSNRANRRSIKFGVFLLLACTLVGCGGDGAHEFNGKLSELGDRPKEEMAQLQTLLQGFDGSTDQSKAIDAAYAKVLEKVQATKVDLAKLQVPSGVDQGEEMFSAFQTYVNDIEKMLADDWAQVIKLMQQASTAEGAALADLHAKLRLLASNLQTKARTTDMAMQAAQESFAKANDIRLER